MNQANHYDVIVLGAGAAGLLCALTAGHGGKRVLVLEKSNKPGKKILMSGGGRCNFTNIHTSAENFLSANPHFCKSALKRYTPWHFIEMVNQHDIPYHEKELGQLFCDRSSKDIVNMLLDECADAHVSIRLDVEVLDSTLDLPVQVKTSQGTFSAENLVIATGGLSIPKMGGSGFGYELAERLGLQIRAQRAGLVPFVFTDAHKALFSALSGASIEVEVCSPETSQAPSFRHQMLFTHRGLSGPSMLQISSYWDLGQTLKINLMPEVDDVTLDLTNYKLSSPQKKLAQWLCQYWPNKVAVAFIEYLLAEFKEKTLQDLSKEEIKKIANSLSCWQLKPSGTEGYRTSVFRTHIFIKLIIICFLNVCNSRRNAYCCQ
ncbi:aminoacetone oxidase family FAD-binding enzyme [Marinicella sp. S1101]|uniref:NAD(P)/FAD-dependent oxidoreductase n=1 Tax=Marinicella marina TaxID=2996016 RepID=UPI002260E8EB|nr:aminoacetone oxidase family FAD-binding enzyme [Marinicella marina]MCX7553728.1 aminoacetone oxidase family FAD-binding enzyme [Marinicella marina]